MKYKTTPSQAQLRGLFTYDNGQLYWTHAATKKEWRGKRAGTKHPDGYIYISVHGVRYMAHRLIWSLMMGAIDDNLQIDHINRNRSDNRITNLRNVTKTENMRNMKMMKTNKSGYNGVHWLRNQKKWVATININGERVVLKQTIHLQLAIEARKKAEKKYGYHNGELRNGEVHNQTER